MYSKKQERVYGLIATKTFEKNKMSFLNSYSKAVRMPGERKQGWVKTGAVYTTLPKSYRVFSAMFYTIVKATHR